jgi:hypothetical protein
VVTVAGERRSLVGSLVVAEIQMEMAATWRHCSVKKKTSLWVNVNVW